MHTINLDKFLSGHVFAFVFIFCRIGSIIMLFPGIGEAFVPARMRLMFAFMVSFLLVEPLMALIPPPPAAIPDLTLLLGYEIMAGLFFGTFLRLLVGALETAGSIIGIQTGLSNATILNPALAIQSPLASAFLGIVGIVLIFITGMDHYLIRSMVEIYGIFPPGGKYMPGDMVQVIIQSVNRSFIVGVELVMPFFVMGLLLYVALGLIQKLLPQVQLFLVVLPVQIWGGLLLLAITISGIMTVWLHYFDASVESFISH